MRQEVRLSRALNNGKTVFQLEQRQILSSLELTPCIVHGAYSSMNLWSPGDLRNASCLHAGHRLEDPSLDTHVSTHVRRERDDECDGIRQEAFAGQDPPDVSHSPACPSSLLWNKACLHHGLVPQRSA